MFSACYTNLEEIAPDTDIDPAHINPGQKPPDEFRDDITPTCTTITIVGPDYSAGLSKRYVTPPAGLLQAFTKFTFSYQIRPSETASLFSQVHENDFRMSGPAGEVYVGDTQLDNISGVWMLGDGKGGWVNTLFKPGLFPGDVWTPVSVVYEVAWGKSLTFGPITVGTELYTPPAAIATIPAAALAWQPGLLGFQNQEGLNALGGTYTCSRRQITIQMQ